ncbi:MAG: copper resistance protein CopC [Actinomycetota bacterium]|nr:copper resistance protein CopC [Actinomycetota bacterium]
MARARTWALAAVMSAVLVAGVLAGSARTAFAHASLLSSTPVANSVLEEGPAEIVLQFSEPIEVGMASIRLFDGAGSRLDLGDPVEGADDATVRAAVPALGDDVYAVVWRITSVDGHVVDGAFSFQVGTTTNADGQALIESVRRGVRAAPTVGRIYGVSRFLAYLATVALLGAGWWIMQGAALGRAAGRKWRALPVVSAVALLVASIGAFTFFGAQAVAGSVGDAFSPSVWRDVAGTRTGALLAVRIGLAAAWLALVKVQPRLRPELVKTVAFVMAVCTLSTFSAAGHPTTLDPSALWIAVDLLHLAAVSAWLGGLLAFALLPRAALALPAGELLAKRFSRSALLAVPVVVVTGAALGWQLNDGLEGLTDTAWGEALVAKIIAVMVVLAIAVVSRWFLHRRSARSMWGTVVMEAALGILVVGLAATIVGMSPEPPIRSQAYAEQLASPSGLIAVVSLGPGSIGSNEVHITVTPTGGSLTPVVKVSARVSLPSADLPAAPVDLVKEGQNHYSGWITFPRSGQWELELIVQVTASEQQSLKAVVPIP